VVLVKHFFSSFDAGIYAAVSTLGKIILFASAPVATVMFPLLTRRFAKKENYVGMFLLSIGLTVVVVAGVIILYYLFPYFVMSLLYGDKYFSGVYLLVPYAIYTGLISLSGLFVNLFLSVNHNKIVIFPMFGAILQLIGINIFHQTISQVVWVSISVAALLFLALSVYFLTSGLLNGYKIDEK
jgi:O-antigen/teichoic acid export membrane protein